MKHYVIRGGRDGKARLEVLTRVLQPSTGRLLDEIGLADRMSCLDLGCGAGEVTVEMARRVGAQGAVVGVDEDDAILQLARRDTKDAGLNHVSYQQAEAANLQLEPVFDLVYARFLLTHVGDGARVLESMIRTTRRPGIVAVEDIEFSGHVCYPDSRSFARYVELYREVVRRRGHRPETTHTFPRGRRRGLSDTHNLVDRNDRPVHPLSRPRGGLRQRVWWRRSCFRWRLTREGGGFAASRWRGGVT
jgi:2-polyprenyl-3-methyl-5-hydroxy-6-metoxy-1,4-benzoquinol methylase